MHPVKRVHAAQIGRGVDVAAQFVTDGGGLVHERRDALRGAELRAVPVEPLELREAGGVVLLLLGQHANLHGDIGRHGGERLHVVPAREAQAGGGFAVLFQILAEGLDLGRVLDVHGGQSDFIAVGDVVELVLRAALAHPFGDDRRVLRVMVAQRTLNDRAARLGQFEHPGNGLRIQVGWQRVQTDGFAEGQFHCHVGIARANGAGAGEEAKLLRNRPEPGRVIQLTRHGAINIGELKRVLDALGAVQVRLDEQRERGFACAQLEGLHDLRRARTRRKVHGERLAGTSGLPGAAGLRIGGQRLNGIRRRALRVHRGAEVIPRGGFAGRDGRGPVAILAAFEHLARRVVKLHLLAILGDIVVVGPVAPVVPNDFDRSGGGLGIAEAEIDVVGAAQLIEQRVARELRCGERCEVGGDEDGVNGTRALGLRILRLSERHAVTTLGERGLVALGSVVIQSPVPVEVAAGELGGEAIVLGRLAQAIGFLENCLAASRWRDANGKGVVEERRTLILGPDLVSAVGGHLDVGGDFGWCVGLVRHGIAQPTGPDAAKNHVLIQVMSPAPNLPALARAETILSHALHVLTLDDDADWIGRRRDRRGGPASGDKAQPGGQTGEETLLHKVTGALPTECWGINSPGTQHGRKCGRLRTPAATARAAAYFQSSVRKGEAGRPAPL